MARSEIDTEFNTFVGGILTEANPINYPVGYTLDEENFILERNGTRRRRPGLKLDTTSSNIAAKAISAVGGLADTAIYRSCFLWDNPSRNNENLYTIGFTFDIADASDTSVDQSWSSLVLYETENPSDITNNFLADYPISRIFTTNGIVYKDNLIISERTYQLSLGFPIQPRVHILKYDGTTSLDPSAQSGLQVRDFLLVPDSSPSIDGYERKASLSLNHLYNLVNAGWTDKELTSFYTATNTFPSNADNLSFAKNKGSAFTPSYLQNSVMGFKDAPRGKLVVPAFGISSILAAAYIDLNTGFDALTDTSYQGVTLSGDSDLYERFNYDNLAGGIVDAIQYGGRLFYLCDAITTPLNGSAFVAYSQINGASDRSYASCHQVNDPTCEDLNNVVATDGGALDVSSAGQPLRIFQGRSRVLVFGSDAVLEILSEADVFTPTSVGIREVTNNSISHYSTFSNNSSSHTGPGVRRVVSESLVSVKDSFYYWSPTGVINLTYNKESREFNENNLTDNTIQSLYNTIPDNCRAAARGEYSKEDSVIIWCYSLDSENPKKFTRALIYDLVLNAWTKFKFYNDDGCYILDLKIIPSAVKNNNADDFLRQLIFVTYAPDIGVTTGYLSPESFEDFQGSTNSGEVQAFMQTGYLNANDSARQKQTTYIVPSFLRTEDGFTDDGSGNLTPTNESSCLISAWWDYVDDASFPKANDTFEAYKYNRLYIPSGAADTFDYGQTVITTKNRLTGRGRALSLRFETSEGKDCRLLGWNLNFSQGTKV